jgi:hypothetical protein
MPRFKSPQAEPNFATYPLRRLDAEVLIDAINKITGSTDLYTSAIPEPFTYIPQSQPSIAIADGSITSPFLALFGRSARATGMDSERYHKQVPAQWLHLLNSSHIQRKLEQGPKLKEIIEARRSSAWYCSSRRGSVERRTRTRPTAMTWAHITPRSVFSLHGHLLSTVPSGRRLRDVWKGLLFRRMAPRMLGGS